MERIRQYRCTSSCCCRRACVYVCVRFFFWCVPCSDAGLLIGAAVCRVVVWLGLGHVLVEVPCFNLNLQVACAARIMLTCIHAIVLLSLMQSIISQTRAAYDAELQAKGMTSAMQVPPHFITRELL